MRPVVLHQRTFNHVIICEIHTETCYLNVVLRKCIWSEVVSAQKAVSVKACFARIRKLRFWNLGCLELDFTASSLLKTR